MNLKMTLEYHLTSDTISVRRVNVREWRKLLCNFRQIVVNGGECTLGEDATRAVVDDGLLRRVGLRVAAGTRSAVQRRSCRRTIVRTAGGADARHGLLPRNRALAQHVAAPLR